MFDEVTVLAADDDGMNLDMLEVMLGRVDCRVIKSYNGQEAIDVLVSEPNVDIIILDLKMPIMDGYEAIKRIKRNLDWRDIPIIVVTADSREVAHTLALGANDFISKPYNLQELRLRVMNQVRTKKLADLARDLNRVLELEVAKRTAALQDHRIPAGGQSTLCSSAVIPAENVKGRGR